MQLRRPSGAWRLLPLLGALLAAPAARAANFAFAYAGDAGALDPYTRDETVQLSLLRNVYEPLVGNDEQLNLIPVLATGWKQVKPTVWRFDLRRGVKWADGTPFTAADVVFSIGRFTDPASLTRSDVPTVASSAAIDADTVEITTKVPDPILPRELTNLYIMSKAWCDAHDADKPVQIGLGQKNYAVDHAMGTGPYMIESRQADSQTVFVRNPNWWGKPTGNVDRATFYVIANDSTRVSALVSGQVALIDPVPVQDIPRLKHSADITLLEKPSLRTIFLGMDQWRPELPSSNVKGKNPLQDARVRRAFALAIDENAIVRVIMQGLAHPTFEMWGPGVNGYDAALDKRPATDPAAAKKLLAEAGYPDGFTLGMDCPNNRYVGDAQICTAIVSMLAKIGVKVNLLAQDKSRFFAKIQAPGFDTDFYLLGWSPNTDDALSPLFSLIGTYNGARGQVNYGRYSNAKMDALIAGIATETDQTKRQDEIDQAIRLLQGDVGYIPLHQQDLLWATRGAVTVQQPATGVLELQYVTVR